MSGVNVAGPLDDLVKTYVDPVMKEGGFRRLRLRRWWITSPGGNAVFVQIRPYLSEPTVEFHVEVAAFPAVLREYHDERSGSKPVKFEWGLLQTRPKPPDHLSTYPHPGSSLWGVRLDGFDVTGPKLRDHFRDFAIHLWKSFLSLPALAQAAYGGRRADLAILSCYGPDFGKVILEVDEGDPRELEESIDALIAARADRNLLEWLRRRVHARVEGAATCK
ncbi:hypothetical protein QRX50_21005 [Amycolatopsis carbonis]|uniref:DUF4304 domain-containing protein n=1 Tax=Amycolatopsis carbonis TaxID=715471 RepID=A0A9Y2ING6_9PSEU|nr:hypothetical protein [Amycolatopsis sp. 2-15]WIX83057.1 hypothetical protein QRX50_21005 [Amycolatopsis sp. 2-15]